MLQLFNRRPRPLRSSNGILPTKQPTSKGDSWQNSKGHPSFPRRYGRITALITSLAFLGVLGWLLCTYEFEEADIVEIDPHPELPPSYSSYHERERRLPQHSLSLPPPEGRHAKFFWARNHVHASGWGNAMQELILNSHLAYSAKRSFVFDNYTWNRDGPDFSEFKGKLIPSRIPLSAIISGPTIGGSFPAVDKVPRAVSKEYFYEVCPSPTVIRSQDVDVDGRLAEAGADIILEKWVEKLNSIEDPCVELDIESLQIFGIWVFGSVRILPIWPSLATSPIMTEFAWSPLVAEAFKKNKRLLGISFWPFFPPSGFPALPAADQFAPIPGLLALHIRRGDFVDHCSHFAKWSSTWNGFNSFPSLPDQFSPPTSGGGGQTTPERDEHYLKHCFPSIDQIVQKVLDIKSTSTGRNLKNVYIMSNAGVDWIEDLKTALRGAAKWGLIASSRDLKLSKEQKYIAQSVDMMIGQKAQVFVGNGFSSLSSNVVMLRMSRHYPPDSNRFW